LITIFLQLRRRGGEEVKRDCGSEGQERERGTYDLRAKEEGEGPCEDWKDKPEGKKGRDNGFPSPEIHQSRS